MPRAKAGKRHRGTWALSVLLWCMFAALPVHAQRVLAITTTLSATREAGKTYAQVVDFANTGVVSACETLPGTILPGPPQWLPDRRSLLLPTASRISMRMAWDYVTQLDLSTFGLSALYASPTGEIGSLVALLDTPALGALRIGTQETGFMEARPLHMETAPLRWKLPGIPVAAQRLDHTPAIAVLCDPAARSGALLLIVNGADLETPMTELYIENGHLFDATPVALAASEDGRLLFTLLSGHAADRPSGEPLSWLHILRVTSSTPPYTLEELAPVEIPGVAQPADAPLLAAGTASCWVETRTPGSGFAHVLRVTADGTPPRKDAQVALANVTAPVRVAAEPGGDRVAVAIDNTVEIWRGTERGQIQYNYSQGIQALCWAEEGLFAGEGRNVHHVDPGTAAPVQTASLQTGWVAEITPLAPAAGPVAARAPSTLPGEIVFHAEAAGQEIKAFRVGCDVPPGTPWHIQSNRDDTPWLVIHPADGLAPGVVYMGVDPGRYVPGRSVSSSIGVVTGAANIQDPKGQPVHEIGLRILPFTRSDVRRILWIWPDEKQGIPFRDTSDPRGMREAGELLAAAPHFFAHREAVVPLSESLEPFTIVVLDAAAAIRGAVTRQALLDYVMHGGSLLFIGRYLPEADPLALSAWLQPLRIEVDTRTPINGLFNAIRHPRTGSHWRNERLINGCAVYTDDASAIAVPVEGNLKQAALIACSYGRGRVAILAAPTPLLSESLRDPEHQRLAGDLFRWLAQAGTDAAEQDMDGDGIPDGVEDRNGNGLVDPGETDYLDADTDADGLSDGTEDVDLNGIVNDGETSPFNPDSNSNGICDGADPAPLPLEGAPIVAGVNPAQCPAEGGMLALVSGRNFAPGTTIWFGDTAARSVRILRNTDAIVEVPPCASAAGGDVPVRARNASGHPEGALPGGFHYAPLSHASLVLHSPVFEKKEDGSYHGTVSIRLDVPEGTLVNQVVLLLKAAPFDNLAWEMNTASDTETPSGSLVTRPAQGGALLVVALREKAIASLHGELGNIAWNLPPSVEVGTVLQFTIDQPRVLAPGSQPLDVTARPVSVTLR